MNLAELEVLESKKRFNKDKVMVLFIWRLRLIPSNFGIFVSLGKWNKREFKGDLWLGDLILIMKGKGCHYVLGAEKGRDETHSFGKWH